MTRDRVLIHGMPTPLFGVTAELRIVVTLYVDDLAVIALECEEVPDSLGAAVRVRDWMKKQLLAARFGCHKEEQGPLIKNVGVLLGGYPPEARAVAEKQWLVYESTMEVVRRGVCWAEWLEESDEQKGV